MSRLAPLDKALVLILVPLWVVCFGLSVRSLLVDTATPGVYVYPAESADVAPIVLGVAPPLQDETELRAGDRLLRIGDTDLRGVGPIGLRSIVGREAAGSRRPEASFERAGVVRRTAVPIFPLARYSAAQRVASTVFLLCGIVLLLRSGGSDAARSFGRVFLVTSFSFTTTFVGSPAVVWLSLAVAGPVYIFAMPLGMRAALRFPRATRHPSTWRRVAPWLFAVHGPCVVARMFGVPSWGGHAVLVAGFAFVVEVVFFAALLAVLTRTYRHEDAIGRRQLRWIVVGAWWALAPPILCAIVAFLYPDLAWLFFASVSALALLPVSFLFAIARYNLFDIDHLISVTASYNILAVVLGAGALIVVPRLAEAASGFVGIDPGTGQVVLSLALAAVLIPAHRRLRPQIDRVFFKERYALDRGIAELLPTLSGCTDTRELTERAGAGLHRLLRPEACVVYAGVEQSYAPVFVEGRAVPPAFEADSPLVGTLRGRRAPLSLSDAGRLPAEAALSPFDRAALETLQAEVVVPVRQDDALAAFVCLGPKRSGDVYTSTDLSLLAAVAETVSQRLQRFDQEDVTREAQAMQESLRRYVPGAVAEQLSSGAELISGEREVSVLFVDIRGYTGFSESRASEEIFSTVNRYTETVSQIVQKHSGSVVEFNGDGMMAVFGAPRELAHKERAAVEAGVEIVGAVGGMSVEDAQGGPMKLSVGVGIATGEAFVGNIQAVDRLIWSAIGNTTNLAARLQGLTRELNASLVIDRGTWERAEHAGADFEKRPDVPIRGRRETQDVYVLPMPARS